MKLELVPCKLSHLKSFTVCIPLFWLTTSGLLPFLYCLLPLWGTKFNQRIGLWWERIFLVNWSLNVCWFGRDAHSLYVTSSSTIKCLNMTDDSIHMHQLFYALSRSKSRSPFQISKLCICVHACYEGPASTFMNIYIYILFHIPFLQHPKAAYSSHLPRSLFI